MGKAAAAVGAAAGETGAGAAAGVPAASERKRKKCSAAGAGGGCAGAGGGRGNPSGGGRRFRPSSTRPAVPDFTLESVAEFICEAPPPLMDARDPQLCPTLLQDGVDRKMLQDMVRFLLQDSHMDDDARRVQGPPKFAYGGGGDFFDCFDFYAAAGCPNCGAEFDLEDAAAVRETPPALTCVACGHRPCPVHFAGDSDTLVERLEQAARAAAHAAAHAAAPAAAEEVSAAAGLATAGAGAGAAAAGSASAGSASAPLYVRGFRESYYFGQSAKDWWQAYYLPRACRLSELDATMTTIAMMGTMKAPVIKELCEVCGNREAFFTTFQARSADEGMTIMFECTRCHARKIFNN